MVEAPELLTQLLDGSPSHSAVGGKDGECLKQMPEAQCLVHLWIWWLYFFFPTPPVLADNLKSNPGIKWQYFSSEEGIFTVFPAHKFRCKGSYEHRSRYVDLFAKVLITA